MHFCGGENGISAGNMLAIPSWIDIWDIQIFEYWELTCPV
jgi:hypothetical protein